MLRPIVRYGATILQTPAVAVTSIDADVQQLITDMIETMYAAPGVGLAAPQVGVAKRVAVIDTSVGKRDGELLVMINPVLMEREGMQLEEEGCLSVPGFAATVARPAKVVARFLDRDGRECTRDADGLLARAFQHEVDHLDGHLFLDHLRGLKREMILRKVRKLQRAGRW